MKFFKPTLVAVALLAVVGCQEGVKEDALSVENKAPVLDTEIQKQAYGLGASIGMYMQRNLDEHDKLGLTLSKELIIRGFVDSINDKSVIEKEDIQALLMNLDKMMKNKDKAVTILTKGVEFLLKKNKVTYFKGIGSFKSKNDVLDFNIDDVYTFSNEHGEYCGISVGYETSIENNYKIKERSGSGSYMDSEDGFLEITIITNPEITDIFKIKQKDNGNYQNETLKVEYFNNYNHNGIIYKHVIIGTKDTINNSPKISKVVRAIPGGILEFHDFENKKNWKSINR